MNNQVFTKKVRMYVNVLIFFFWDVKNKNTSKSELTQLVKDRIRVIGISFCFSPISF